MGFFSSADTCRICGMVKCQEGKITTKMVKCRSCGNTYHGYCLNKGGNMSTSLNPLRMANPFSAMVNWTCPNCSKVNKE
jgi:hypothetical protein